MALSSHQHQTVNIQPNKWVRAVNQDTLLYYSLNELVLHLTFVFSYHLDQEPLIELPNWREGTKNIDKPCPLWLESVIPETNKTSIALNKPPIPHSSRTNYFCKTLKLFICRYLITLVYSWVEALIYMINVIPYFQLQQTDKLLYYWHVFQSSQRLQVKLLSTGGKGLNKSFFWPNKKSIMFLC